MTEAERVKHRVSNREYRKRHPERLKELRRKFCVKHWKEVKRRYYAKYPDKLKAHRAVWNALHRGALVKPKQCTACGKTGRIEAHHHRGYAWEHRLDIVWLCTPCHHEAEKRKEQHSG